MELAPIVPLAPVLIYRNYRVHMDAVAAVAPASIYRIHGIHIT